MAQPFLPHPYSKRRDLDLLSAFWSFLQERLGLAVKLGVANEVAVEIAKLDLPSKASRWQCHCLLKFGGGLV